MLDTVAHALVLPVLTGVEEKSGEGIPREMVLHQNYPNPFNPSTQIRYDLNSKCWVSLKIYNLLGQEVCTLVHALQPSGVYLTRWDGRNDARGLLGSGVYFCRIIANGFSDTRKMILVR